MSAPRTTDPRGTSAAVNVPAAKSNPEDPALPHQQCPRSSQGTPPSYPPRCALYLKRAAESVYAHPETFTSLTLNLLVLDRLGLNAGKACVDRGRALRQRYASIYQRHVLAADRAVCQSQQYDLPHRGQLDSETLHKLHLIRTSWHLRAAGRQVHQPWYRTSRPSQPLDGGNKFRSVLCAGSTSPSRISRAKLKSLLVVTMLNPKGVA